VQIHPSKFKYFKKFINKSNTATNGQSTKLHGISCIFRVRKMCQHLRGREHIVAAPLQAYSLLCSCPHGVGHYALTAVVCLSVCLSVPYLVLSRKRKSVESWNLAWRSPWHGWPWPHLDVEKSKVKVTRPRNALTEKQQYLRNGKAYKLQT